MGFSSPPNHNYSSDHNLGTTYKWSDRPPSECTRNALEIAQASMYDLSVLKT